ncbi:universal stress protein [Kineosporia sp. NBRC 101731]|uniref:universal stress protein n=1 Tax=Kineosporia sp. NBRC 101731 TaxID=3032199 RepID=UPI0024A031CB|nr:universal stress protein [Kineosporia sp. NBRC 101731]GLY32165.1 universal stress protein [Kineosporia sp. NBRC 101731]
MSTDASTARPLVVVGVDGSEQSKRALQWAGRLERLPGAPQLPQIQAVIVWDYPAPYGVGAPMGGGGGNELAQGILDNAVKSAFPEGIPENVTQVVRRGGVAQTLIDLSKGAQLAVVGSRGHGGIAGLFLGSVSMRVAERAACPVLVVHGDKDTSVPAGAGRV